MFATATVLGGYGFGILVRHDNGRPIKVEGNPLHPASLGGTSAIGQAEILGFRDPDRSRGLTRDGEPQSRVFAADHAPGPARRPGTVARRGLPHPHRHHHLPTLARQITDLKQRYPAMQWHDPS